MYPLNDEMFRRPMGPTQNCLSSEMAAKIIAREEVTQDVMDHIKTCDVCRTTIDRSRAALSRLKGDIAD